MDPNLIRRAQQGDMDAFDEMVGELQGPLFALCRRMLGNRQDAEEVTQDALVRLHRALPRVDSEREILFFARRIAVNECIDKLSRRRHQPAPGDDKPFAILPSREASPERLALSSEAKERVLAALDSLTPRERAAFVLRGLEDQDFAAVARTMGVREVTARRLYGLARLRLMRLLHDAR